MANTINEVCIIGGGISGAALLYELAKNSDYKNVVLLEKHADLASVNSHGRNNSQTLHCGDIETNYTLEKALQVQKTSQMLVDYVHTLPEAQQQRLLFKYQKMVLAVGDGECDALAQRYEQFSPHFSAMQWLDAEGIARIEPNICKGRRQRVQAIALEGQYSAVDFNLLALSFAEQARTLKPNYEIRTQSRVSLIEQEENAFRVEVNGEILRAKTVVVSAGGHSLLFAQRMGYGREFACLPVAGSFYYTPEMLNGKVYTVQDDRLPFAAIHGDPDILAPGKTRFGPTALVLPVLERHQWSTLPEFLRVTKPEPGVLKVLMSLLGESHIRSYMIKNMLFEVPGLGRKLFLSDARKIVPSIQLEDLQFARGIGGIRPVMLDKKAGKLHLGEAQINPGNGIIFNMTPSPGATSCLGNAQKDHKVLREFVG